MAKKDLMTKVRRSVKEAHDGYGKLWWVKADAYKAAGKMHRGYCLHINAARLSGEVWYGGRFLGCGYTKDQVVRARRAYLKSFPGVEVLSSEPSAEFPGRGWRRKPRRRVRRGYCSAGGGCRYAHKRK